MPTSATRFASLAVLTFTLSPFLFLFAPATTTPVLSSISLFSVPQSGGLCISVEFKPLKLNESAETTSQVFVGFVRVADRHSIIVRQVCLELRAFAQLRKVHIVDRVWVNSLRSNATQHLLPIGLECFHFVVAEPLDIPKVVYIIQRTRLFI